MCAFIQTTSPGLHRSKRVRICHARPLPIPFRPSRHARIDVEMNSKQNPKPSPRETIPSDATSAPLSPEEEDTFVLEDELVSSEAEEELKIIWNKLPTAAPLSQLSYLGDFIIISTIVAIVYGLVRTTGSLFSGAPYALLSIDTSLSVLPWYAAQSLTRMIAGYSVSFVFSLIYAYIAYRVQFAAQVLMLVIDVLQSIPLLSFLPGVVLGLISIFPGARVGVELAAVLLLFTSMAWNMLLGFYQSLSCIPHDLLDVSKTFRLSPWKRFWTLELPAGAIGLVWNSVISVAGGWFFLISIESFELGNRDFKLPGLGSYLAVAAETSNFPAIFAGLVVLIALIVLIDFLVWRPLIAWSSKFSSGNSNDDARSRSIVLNALQRSPFVRSMHSSFIAPFWDKFVNFDAQSDNVPRMYKGSNGVGNGKSLQNKKTESMFASARRRVKGLILYGMRTDVGRSLINIAPMVVSLAKVVSMALLAGGIGYGVWQSFQLMEAIPIHTWLSIGTAAMATFGRVIAALALSLLWTVPAGVAIGRNPNLAAKVQPIVQIAASVPATALFPFVLLFLTKLGGGLQIGSVALMLLGTMWYVLFNVIAGAQAIPSEFFEVDAVYNKEGRWKRWRSLFLPGIFPYLITGVVTAVGGAWNASIVSEYVVFQGGVMKTHGLGALISEAAASGDYAVLLAGTVAMSLLVLLTNRFVWGPLYKLAETKYRL